MMSNNGPLRNLMCHLISLLLSKAQGQKVRWRLSNLEMQYYVFQMDSQCHSTALVMFILTGKQQDGLMYPLDCKAIV